MNIFDRLFGRKKTANIAEDKGCDERLERAHDKMPPKQDPASKDLLQNWARQACNGKTSIRITWRQVSRLIDVLTEAVQEFRPGVPCTMDEMRNAIKLKCAVCGFWDPQVINILYMREHIGNLVGFGPLTELANSGVCPRCRTSEVKVTFSPGKIGLNIKSAREEIGKKSTTIDTDRSKADLGEEMAFRMVIEDTFALQSGKAIVGNIQSGSIRKGDKVECRTRAGTFIASIDRLEAFGKNIEQAHVGQNIGICLCNCPKEKVNSIDHGDVLCTPNEQISQPTHDASSVISSDTSQNVLPHALPTAEKLNYKNNPPEEIPTAPRDNYLKKITALEPLIPSQFQTKLRLLRKRLSDMAITGTTQARDELESRNISLKRVWGDQVQHVRLHTGSADAIYYFLLTCLADDFSKGASDMGIEEIPVVTNSEASSVQVSLQKLSFSNPRIAEDPGLRAYYENDLARRLRKHRAKESGGGETMPAKIRKITIKVHFYSTGTFGPHDILRVGEDCYYLMPCADYDP